MRTIYKTKNTTLTLALKKYLEDKIEHTTEKLLGLSDESALLESELALVTKHHRKGDVWRAEANLAFGPSLIP